MKKVLLLFTVLYAALSMFSFSNGFGNPATGAPGESGASCGQGGCHSAGAFNPQVNVSLLDNEGNLVEEYFPGESYTVALKIEHTGLPSGYGFQIVCLSNEENAAVNNFKDLPAGIGESLKLDRQYVEQNMKMLSDSISLNWTAPEKETGPVTFYAIANAVNGNNSPQGDGTSSGSFIFGEALGLSTTDLSDLNLNVYPNPTQDYLNIPTGIKVKEMTLYDLQGRELRTSNSNTMSISDLSVGRYIVRVQDLTDKTYSASIQKI